MEEAGHRGRRNKNAPVGTILLLMCMIVPAYFQPSEDKCPDGDYRTNKGICCNKCFPGSKLVEECNVTGHRSKCVPCPHGQYRDKIHYAPTCLPCSVCKGTKNEKTLKECARNQNTICQCYDGYYRFYIDSLTYECRKCAQCGPGETEKQNCTNLTNTVCECKETFYRVKRKCEPCESCSSECQHLCSRSSVNPKSCDKGEEFFTYVIAGVVAGALVLLVLVALITHMVTKKKWEQRSSQPSSQPTDDSPEPYEVVLLSSEESSVNSDVEVTRSSPVGSEQLPPNLPDCVPLEIETADLIYSVLDLVSALQVKQLVRTLGVRDTEIEQAELDHRTCREAHYQMLRLWAERVPRADGGGQRGILHWPLLQELLDKLRTMRLGGVAEELEIKFSIQ
ncbi:tumor necrosis factor receptor superfamily member 1A [Limanda limanda]|uniref:tumor necrosis factor receptor superfamily member 1A n=1 Tax=Limanda limanda TaxID=27771 RepID=UPI0029C7FB63|nr:tumor necrosis factor receptor superfamily member 1A [Limanda limanda]XP_060936734.1 tumor necrosis factor receptor superfamily member 1A [Limanda limanda]XP_060936735.1 tumor necrosis factor receptor superfamily member 1A [Limanda limanda]XP_060936736.1 tumor necrosis factor receptor superfamily member 1A [Limanda limanda]